MAHATYIGYFNPKDHPLTIGVGGQGVEILAGQPVVDGKGLLIPLDAHLDQLVGAGLLTRIQADHPEFKNWNALVKQRSNIRFVKPSIKTSPAPVEKEVTVVSSDRGLQQESLPEGATMVVKGGRQVFEMGGKTFNSVKALRAYADSL